MPSRPVLTYRQQGLFDINHNWDKMKQLVLPFTSNYDFMQQVTLYLTVLAALGFSAAVLTLLVTVIILARLGSAQDKVLLMQAFGASLFALSVTACVLIFRVSGEAAFGSALGAGDFVAAAAFSMALCTWSAVGIVITSVRHVPSISSKLSTSA